MAQKTTERRPNWIDQDTRQKAEAGKGVDASWVEIYGMRSREAERRMYNREQVAQTTRDLP